MNKTRFFQCLLLMAILYQLVVITWISQDKISFGIGLGGLLYFFLLIASLAISGIMLVLSLIVFKTDLKNKILLIATPISVTLSLFITFCYTFGRGHENPWNGEVFNPKLASEIILENKLDSLDKLIVNDTNNFKLYLTKARMCFEYGGYNQPDLIPNYKIAINYNDTSISALEELHNIYFMIGAKDSARMISFRILEIDSTHKMALYWKTL